jgi:hypothetical protein
MLINAAQAITEHGKITIEAVSQLGVETTFTIRLPMSWVQQTDAGAPEVVRPKPVKHAGL